MGVVSTDYGGGVKEDTLAFRERMLEVAGAILDDLPLALHGFTRDGWLRSAVSSTVSVRVPDPRLGVALLSAYEWVWESVMGRNPDDDWLSVVDRALTMIEYAGRLANDRGVVLPRLAFTVELLHRTLEELSDDD